MDAQTLEIVRLFFYLFSAVVAFFLISRLIKALANNPGIVAFFSILSMIISGLLFGATDSPVQPIYLVMAFSVSVVFLFGAAIKTNKLRNLRG